MAARVLIIEDSKEISDLVAMHLRDEGYEVEQVFDGRLGYERAGSTAPDLLVLDIMLPRMNGIDICRQLRAAGAGMRIIMLTSRSDEIDTVLGLEVGADDYITKPFKIREVVARVRAHLRRINEPQEEGDTGGNKELTCGDLKMDLVKRRVFLGEKLLTLTPKEYDLLLFLASNSGKPYSREQLLDRVWQYDYRGYERTVTSHINRLRAKIEPDPAEPRYILTEWGVGYYFAEE